MNLKELQGFAAEEKARLERQYRLEADERVRILAHMAKVTEEAGELADAVLTHLGLQRREKLENHTREHLEKEFADVIYTTTIMADILDIDLDALMAKRVEEIRARHDAT